MVQLFSKRWLGSIDQIRVRFAPSPTGQLHLGSLRTALYNFLFARHHKGRFVLRIEDTDQTRVVPGSEENVERILKHYGLHHDEGPRKLGPYGPYKQSERLPFYRDVVDRLIDSGHAYRCFCSEERLSLLRRDAVRRNQIPKYDKKCRSIDSGDSRRRAESGEPFVVRLKLDQQSVSFTDDIYGVIEQYIDESDMIILKSDGFPTYHLANVVDDQFMQISHVIRGMEWLSSTGKHVILYKALGWSHPRWLHLPLITKDGKKKLSKRDKDGFIDYYEQYLGALPDAVLNLLIRNGSGIRDFDPTHLYTLDEMITNFDEDTIGKRSLQLDEDCLARYGRMAFQMADIDSQILPAIKELMKSDLPSIEIPDDEYLKKVVAFLKSNEENFAYLSSLTRGDFRWFLSRPATADRLLHIFDPHSAVDALIHLQECESLEIETLKTMAEKLGWAYTEFLTLIRISLIDSSKGPPIKELASFFGISECQKRFHNMARFIQSQRSYLSQLRNETL